MSGVKVTKNSSGELHSVDDEPAVDYGDGTRWWFKDGLLHRDDDKPAMVWRDGTRSWWRYGVIGREGDQPAAELTSAQ